ncbi:hypothetical protein QBC39DRAFT_56425 [Podospora conica]|nr:hypothetical protein QBC39DRAFT_56425 [Schizothecium conicum]
MRRPGGRNCSEVGLGGVAGRAGGRLGLEEMGGGKRRRGGGIIRVGLLSVMKQVWCMGGGLRGVVARGGSQWWCARKRDRGSEAGPAPGPAPFHDEDGTFGGRANSAPFVRRRVRSVIAAVVCLFASLQRADAGHVDTAEEAPGRTSGPDPMGLSGIGQDSVRAPCPQPSCDLTLCNADCMTVKDPIRSSVLQEPGPRFRVRWFSRGKQRGSRRRVLLFARLSEEGK